MPQPTANELFVNWITGEPIPLFSALSSVFVAGYPGLVPPADDPIDPNKALFQDGWNSILAKLSIVNHGQCYISLDGSDLLLSPYNGNNLIINSNLETIPDAGISLAPTSLTVDTNYYIYAFMSSGTMTLEASTIVYATQAGTGIKIKDGDATRTLVGFARTITGPAWSDTDGAMYVLSWFNRKLKRSQTSFTVDRSTTSTSVAEIDTEIRNSFICWDDTPTLFWCPGSARNDSSGGSVGKGIGFNGITPEPEFGTYQAFGATARGNLNFSGTKQSLTEGLNYATALGIVDGGTGTYSAATGTISSATLIVLGIWG